MNAHWMEPEDAVKLGLFEERNAAGVADGVLIGTSAKQGRYIWYRGDGHTMIIAPPGSGKGQGFVIPNCLHYPGSMLVIDPKGENAAITARHRRDTLGHEVHIIDPFGVSRLGKEFSHAALNPLDWLLTTDPLRFMADCYLLAQALVAPEAAQHQHFHTEAVYLMRALILYLYAHEPQNLNLVRLRALAFSEQKIWMGVFKLMADSEVEDLEVRRAVREAGNRFLGLDEKAQQTHRSTVQKNLEWLSGPALKDTVLSSSFDVKAFKGKRQTVYLCIPGETRELYKPYVRCLLTLVILGLYRTSGKGDMPVQLMCDEFYSTIGYLKLVEEGVADLRGHGARFAFVFQDLSQLQHLYPETWKLVETSCGAVIYIGAADDTAEHLSKRLGDTDFVQVPGGVYFEGEVERRPVLARRPLMTPQSIKELGVRKEIVLMQHMPPIRCDRVTAYEDPNFMSLLGDNPMLKAAPAPTAAAPPRAKRVRTVEDYVADEANPDAAIKRKIENAGMD